MPSVPVSQGNSVRRDARPVGAVRPVQLDNSLGEGLEKAGLALGDAAEAQDQINRIYDEAAVKKLDNQGVEEMRQILWTGDDAYFNKQGFDALDARPVTEKSIKDLRERLIGEAKTERQRAMFGEVFDRRMAQESEGIARYSIVQVKQEETKQSVARQINFQNDAISSADNPARLQENIAGGLIELRTQADREGWSPDVLKDRETRFRSDIHKGVIQGKIVNDIDGAAAYLEKHRGDLDWQSELELDRSLKAPLEARWSSKQVDSMMGLLTPVVGGIEGNGGTVSTDNMFAAIVTQESGGKQLKPNGEPITSSKGAVGIAQVMPATGPEAARLAGMAWDPVKFKTDKEYNAALGKAYFEKQLNDFGDPLLAAAAYNAGPGRIRSALKKGGATGWREHIPAETKDYVEKFQERTNTGEAQQGPQRHDLAQLYARADVLAEREGWTFEQRENVKTEIDRRVARDETLLKREEDDAADQAFETVNALGEGFTNISQIPAPVLAKMSPRTRMQFDGIAQSNIKAKTKETDYGAYTALSDAYSNDPEAFLAMRPEDVRTKLSDGDFEQYLGWRRDAMKNGPGGKDAKQITHARVKAIIQPARLAAGVTSTGLKGEPLQKANARIYELEKDVMRNIELWQQNNPGKQIDDQQIIAIQDRMLMRWVPQSGGPDQFLFEANGRPGKTYIPKAQEDRVRGLLARAMGRAPTIEEVVTAYIAEGRGGR